MSEVPLLCSKCLIGDNVRMIKQTDGETCKICTRPFNVFRWQVNDGSKRSKKTLICKTCAVLKNCCQSCMLDVNFLIPIDMRDTALKMAGLDHLVTELSNSRNSEVKAIIADKLQAKGETIQDNEKAVEILNQIAAGINLNPPDPVAKPVPKQLKSKDNTISSSLTKIIKKLPFNGTLNIPDNSITSFFIFGFPEDTPQYVITEYFEQFGKILSITILHRAQCGFIGLNSRKAAEALASSTMTNGLNINKSTAGLVLLNKTIPVRLVWSEIKQLGISSSEHRNIALVVNKIMEQLADKDHKYENGNKKRITNKSGKSKPTTKKTYAAAKSDFEL